MLALWCIVEILKFAIPLMRSYKAIDDFPGFGNTKRLFSYQAYTLYDSGSTDSRVHFSPCISDFINLKDPPYPELKGSKADAIYPETTTCNIYAKGQIFIK